MNYFISCIRDKYCCFDGRARRKEYWMFVLFNFIASFVVGFIDGFLGMQGIIQGLYGLAVFLPGLGVTVRRLHDTDRSGWTLLLLLIPLIGAIILFIFECMDGTPGENRFGPNPKELE